MLSDLKELTASYFHNAGTTIIHIGKRRWMGLCTGLDGCVEWR